MRTHVFRGYYQDDSLLGKYRKIEEKDDEGEKMDDN